MPTRRTRRSFIARGAAAGATVAASGLWLPNSGALGRSASARGVWLPGDLHTHSTYSHDVYGGPTDDNTRPDEAYTLGLPLAGKVLEGRGRGPRYMGGSDHNELRPGPGLAGAEQSLIAVPR